MSIEELKQELERLNREYNQIGARCAEIRQQIERLQLDKVDIGAMAQVMLGVLKEVPGKHFSQSDLESHVDDVISYQARASAVYQLSHMRGVHQVEVVVDHYDDLHETQYYWIKED